MFFRQDRLSFVGEGQCPAFPSISFPLCCRQRRTASGKRVEDPTVRQTNFADLLHDFLRLYVVRPAWNHPPPSFMPCIPAGRSSLSRSFPYTPLCDMECAPPHGIRQRPTLPGDFACLNPAQRAAVKILTKYNAAHWSGQSEK